MFKLPIFVAQNLIACALTQNYTAPSSVVTLSALITNSNFEFCASNLSTCMEKSRAGEKGTKTTNKHWDIVNCLKRIALSEIDCFCDASTSFPVS